MKLHWTRQSLGDIAALWEYIAQDNASAADAMANRIEVAAKVLIRFPEAGRVGRIPKTRELTVSGTPYIVAYSVVRDEVRILGVIHGSRKWPERF